MRAANLCGDADTVAAVTGQVAGAIYGEASIPPAWLEFLEVWDAGESRCRAWLLFEMAAPTPPDAHEQPDGESWTIVGQTPQEECEEEFLSTEASAKPFSCECGRSFANATLQQLHQRRCNGC